eukprot:TRINITY_DN106592_c0_g1_i1.p1 TRINITY_DN106592_c0_g1~~TRINITY_DN106592_c0_g1_i1.p1  ORF type:complete len:595 (+),score=149.00 TRINITY_DN106592_c0_g1_i1:29-1786(+)
MAACETVEIDLKRSDGAWLQEMDSKRLRLLERLAEASAKISDDVKKVTFEFKDGSIRREEGGKSWAEHCVNAALAMKNGETLAAPSLPESSDWAPPVKVLNVPKDECKHFVLGRGGARLQEISDEHGVIAVFVEEVKPIQKRELVLEVGTLVEAKYEGKERWFEAEVKEVGEDVVKVRWTYDDDIPLGEVPKSDIRALPEKPEEPAEEPLKVGDLVDAKFDGKDRMFEAKVTKISDSTVTVKWTYDDDVPESDLDKSDIKRRPKPVIAKLRVYGYDRALLEAELKLLQCVEGKIIGFAQANVSPIEEDSDCVGLVVVPLQNNGEFKGKCVGAKGSMRKKIAAAGGSTLEFPGNDAFIIGTLLERRRTAALIDLVQTQSNSEVAKVPEILEDMCTRITVPGSKQNDVMGVKRANMNRVEEETQTLSFWVPTQTEEKEVDKSEPEFTPVVGEIYEARFAHPKGDRWFEAKVLERIEGDIPKYKVEWQYDPDEEKAELPAQDLRKVGSASKAEPPAADKTLGLFGSEEARKAAEAKVNDLLSGKDPWPTSKRERAKDFWEPESKKPKVKYVVSSEEEERRRKRAARFA